MDVNTLLNLRKFLVPEIVYGSGALSLAGRHAGNFGATRVLVVTDAGVIAAGWAEKVEASLHDAAIPFARFSGVSANPKDPEVMAVVEVYRREECDLILCVGGGSPMDCAKGIGIVVGNDRHILEFEGVDAVSSPGPPLIFIPTTAGTSADISQFAIITDTVRETKIAIISKMVVPDIALVDPDTTVTMPPDLTAATGMDALCHAFEAYVSSAASAITDMAALQAVRLIVENLPGACTDPHNIRFRDNMMMASLMAGLAFSNASLGLVHAMAHSLGVLRDLPHGECNSILLEKVVGFNFPAAPQKYGRLADAMGIATAGLDDDRIADALQASIATLRQTVGIAQGLKQMGVAVADIPRLAKNASRDACLATNPRNASEREIADLFHQVYAMNDANGNDS